MSFILRRRRKASPVGGFSFSGFGPLDAFGKSPTPQAIELLRENLGTAYACANLNAGLIAATPLRLYVRTRRGEGRSRLARRGETRSLSSKAFDRLSKIAASNLSGASDVQEVMNHPLLSLLHRPNAIDQDGVGMSGFSLFEITQAYQEIVGRCYWYVERNGLANTPSALWILSPHLVQQIRGMPGGPLIARYEVMTAGGARSSYLPSEIVPLRMPDLFDPYTGGMSPLRACFEQVRLSRKLDALTNATLDNGGKPSAIWSPAISGDTGGFLGPDEAKRAEAAFRQAFTRGASGGVMVQEQAGNLQILNWPIKDIIDASRVELSKTAICNAFDVPDSKLNRNAANLAAARTGDWAHAKDAGLPRLRRNEAALNRFLIPMYGAEAAERLFLAYDDPPGLADPALELEQSRSAASRGSITRNEDRAMLGLAPVPWGDAPLVQGNWMPIDPQTGLPLGDRSVADKPIDSFAPQITPLLQSIARLEKRVGKLRHEARKAAKEKRSDRPGPNGPDDAGSDSANDRTGDARAAEGVPLSAEGQVGDGVSV
ncbi:MAG: phage portal protein [Phycisphaerae bacterium]|nr:phage portal protein [Phycisphaerae bacterium]